VTFLAPGALALLLAVPLLWWLHRKRDEPTVQRVASLLLYRRAALDGVSSVPRRRFDVTLWCVLGATALLAVAAAGPVVGMEPPSAIVVVDRSVSMARHAASVEGRVPALLGAAAGTPVSVVLHDLGGPAPLADRLPGSLAPHLAHARSLGYPGIVLISDRAMDIGPDVVVIGPDALPARNVGILDAFLDAGGGTSVRVRNHGGGPVTLRVVDGDGRSAEVALAAREEVVLAMPAVQRDLDLRLAAEDGGEWSDDLPEDDHLAARIAGGVQRVRLAGAARAPRTELALSAVCDEVVTGVGVADAVVVIDGDVPADVAVVEFVSGEPTHLDASQVVAHGDGLGAFLPSPARRLVATGRIAGKGTAVWSGPGGALVTAGDRRVTIALDPEHADSTWHLDPSFPVLLAAALDHVVGGPERLVPNGPIVPESEGALPTELVATPDADALRRIIRDPRAAADASLATWLALIAAGLIGVAIVASRGRQ
jgi:aerotolerance regulator-like protein